MNNDAKRLVVFVERLVILVSVAATKESILFARFPGVRQAVKRPALIFPRCWTSLVFLGYDSFRLRPSTLPRRQRILTTQRTSSRNPRPLYATQGSTVTTPTISHPRFHTSPAHDHLPLTIW